MDTLEAKRLLGGQPTAPVAETNLATQPPKDVSLESFAPLTMEAAGEAALASEQQFIKRNTQGDVPLDVQSGLSGWDRFNLSFRREQANQVALLQKKYGKDNVRLSDGGDLIVRALDSETQKPKDILVDERNITVKDLLDLGGAAPELAASILAMRSGQASPTIGKAVLKGIPGMLRDVFTSAAGAEAAGAVKDVAANLVDRGEFNLGDVASERAKMFAGGVVVGGALIPVGKLFSFMESPLNSARGPIQFNAMAAAKELESKTGVKIPLTVGESTGSPLFSRTEVFMEKQPGGSTPFSEFRQKQEDALRKLQAIIMGREPMSDEDLGVKLLQSLRSEVAPIEVGVEAARKDVQSTAQSAIESGLSSLTSPIRRIYPEAVGNEIRAAVTSVRDSAKAKADALYDAVRSIPGGAGASFDAAGLKDSFKKILESLPSPESVTQVATGIVDEFGNPILRSETGKEVLREFVPPNVLARLKSVTSLKDAKFSLSDLQQMRREVYDDIAKGEGVPGLGTHYLAEIGKSLTKSIDDGVSAMPGGQLKTALAAANQHYKEKVVPFNRSGLTEMFRSADDPGNMTGSQIFSKLFSGDRAVQNYNMLKETLGESNPAFVGAKRAILDRIVENSKLVGDDVLDANSFLKNLSNFNRDYREISDDIFGGQYGAIARQAKFMGAAEEGAKISESELQKLISDKSLTGSKFQDLIVKQQKLDDLYKNDIFSMVKKGKVENVKPGELVSRILSTSKTSPEEINQLVGVISKDPELLADVRSKFVENIFRGASRNATSADIDRVLAGDSTRIVSGTGVFKELENPGVRDRVISILGKDAYENLISYMKVEAAREVKQDSFKSAGGIAAGAQIANLTKRGPLRYLDQSIKNFIVAKTLTNETLRNWLSRVPSTDPAGVSLVMSSVPFLQAVEREFSSDSDSIVSKIKGSIDRWTHEKTEAYGKKQEQDRRAQFESFLNQSTNSLTPVR